MDGLRPEYRLCFPGCYSFADLYGVAIPIDANAKEVGLIALKAQSG